MTERTERLIADLTTGQEITGAYLVIRKDVRPFRDPQKGAYVDVTLKDRTGQITARIWDRAEEMAARFNRGDVLRVQGSTSEYRGELQLTVEDFTVLPSDQVDPARFLPVSQRDLADMEAELWRRVEELSDPWLSQLICDLLGDPDLYRDYTMAPAAKQIHHAYLHGLLEHSLEVVQLLQPLMDHHRELHRDLLVVGGLLHDLGKIEEYAYDVDIDFTPSGRLLGHIVLGHQRLKSAILQLPGFPAELALHLEHLILSHHGQREYGAPVLPQTAEAMALHQADLASGKVAQVLSMTQSARQSNAAWSDYDRLMGRYWWAPDADGERLGSEGC